MPLALRELFCTTHLLNLLVYFYCKRPAKYSVLIFKGYNLY